MLKGAAAKATTTATRNKNQFMILDNIRKVATQAAEYRNRQAQKKYAKPVGNLMPDREPLPEIESCQAQLGEMIA